MWEHWDIWFVFASLAAALVLFIGGWWRHDLVALLMLLALTVAGIVPGEQAFLGFGHAAVITVAAVLVVSQGLVNAGAIHPVVRWMGGLRNRPVMQMTALTALVTVCSAFMNNIGALAILMPVAISMARKSGFSPSMLLMPLAFGSLLGGLVTMIGTPPNIIIATFRRDLMGEAFGMFSFAPVGVVVAAAGVAFIVLIGWRLIPKREAAAADELFDIEGYLAEVRVAEDSKLVGKPLTELHRAVEAEVVVVGMQRNKRKIPAPSRHEVLREGDVLTVEVDPEQLKELVENTGLKLAGSKDDEDKTEHTISTEDVKVVEAIVRPDSTMIGRTVRQIHLRWRYGLNLLAVARQGSRMKSALREVKFQAGDILLLQGDATTISDTLAALGCLPLADRELQLGGTSRVIPAVGIFGAAIGLTTVGLLPVQVSFALAAMTVVVIGLVPLRGAYDAIDWPVIVLLGAMIPVGAALETTGGAAMIAEGMLSIGNTMPGWVMVPALLVVTMLLSNVINNAAAAVLMAPIGIRLAEGINASADPFLMAVAIGASCAFLTPIGHQSNTLVMGPGGYRFGDYWMLGLPVSIVTAAVAVPMILWVWPLHPAAG
jgi:di/tricarboxylate transporter